MSSNLFDPSVDVLAKSLDMYLLRHSVIADNIANAETPFFKSRRVEFEQELQKAVDSERLGVEEASRNIASAKPIIYEDPEAEVGQDLNTVDMDREMAALSKNDVKYSSSTQSIAKKFALLKYAVTDGGER